MIGVLSSLALWAGAAPPAPQKMPTVSLPYEKFVLPENGLEVILSPDSRLPIVAVNVWYHAGPVNEAPGRSGFAHLFEHLMFQGSQNVGDDKHFALLNAAGASSVNGTTDYDRTNYFETVPANQLQLALWLEADRMGFLEPSLGQEKLDNQRQVVMNERRQSVENAPYGPSAERLVQLLFADTHPYYGNVIGSMEHLSAATLDDVRGFYRAYYAPANATLVLAGDFDPTHARGLVQRYFSGLSRRAAPDPGRIETAPITAERRATVTEPVQLPRLAMAWLSPPAFEKEDADCDIAAVILGQGDSSRLHRALVYEQELAQDVSANQQSLTLASMFEVTVMVRPGVDLTLVEAEVEQVITQLAEHAPSDAELQRARNTLVTRMISSLQNVGGFGGVADTLNRYNHYLKDPGFISRDLERYYQVTPESVRSAVQRYLAKDRRAVVVTLPKESK